MTEFKQLIEKLCLVNAPSGNEEALRKIILNEINTCCSAYVDKMGNIIAFKKGKNTPKAKVMLDAHLDEVGLIITHITENGFLKFDTVGGIETEALLCKKVVFGNIVGVIGITPVHLADETERNSLPKTDNLYIDIGASTKAEAEALVSVGDIGTFLGVFEKMGSFFKCKALDDRIGCAILITLLKEDAEYDFYATFTVGEEIGLRGAKTAAYSVEPDYSIVLEATTASDIKNVPDEKTVCKLSNGAVISFMDRATLYDRNFVLSAINTAKQNNISVQTKNLIAGGNNAGSISLSKKGVPTLAVSLPCRYIHSPSCVACKTDALAMLDLCRIMCQKAAEADI